MNNVIIVGTGQQSIVIHYNIVCQNEYKIAGFFDIDNRKWGIEYLGSKILEGYKDFDISYLKKIRKEKDVSKFFIAIGNMGQRKRLYNFFIENDWEPINIIHPHAVISNYAEIGKGVLIEAGCLITPNPIIGNNVVINTGSQINHDNYIADHSYIASGVVLSGGVRIGECSLIDDGVIVTLGKKIGSNCIIGAGSVVTKDIPDNVIAYGNPCRIIRENDRY
ncbi:acetyltransferase [Candidatus Cloacimonas acidaminovorans]|uniref:Acetyltransferase (The isoleucine patch superfamily) n=1 Tax=Cloacimonas acidaminovorans (strain Evry) TaxID=459349 RepID=B0VGT6_CLOAI|nr:acetyltransferase [Candidatus Cloacimonas acidaminovorans]CAO80545.1 putative Acetyltransferase (the isoleucine patch superfamily) [Candidatus Cloacimonas acidaminovorans str. Evry]